MTQSLSKIYLHIIFRIKTNSHQFLEGDLPRAHAYIGQLINDTGCVNIWVGGICDHVHALCLLGRDVCVSHLVKEMKRNSSQWVKTLSPYYSDFAWQGGFAAFSVSQSVVANTLAYIQNQHEHHKKMTFKEEYLKFLELYGIEYDDRYVLSD